MIIPVRCLLLLCLGFASVRAADSGYRRLYVFGDSYSDIGAGYIDGNGPTAVAYLAWHLGLTIAPPHGVDPWSKSLIYAVSGAQTGEDSGQRAGDSLLGYGMMNQVRDFATEVNAGRIRFDPDRTLFFLAGGLNDGKLKTEVTIDHLRRQIELLHSLGGRHFTVALLTQDIPGFGITGRRLNPAIAQLAEQMRAQLKIDLWTSQWGRYYDEVLNHPSAYGIVNTTDACAGRALMKQDPTPVGDPATYFYYHASHPSTAVHRIVGQKLFEELAAHPPAP